MTLKSLVMNAYGVKSFQIDCPAWLNSERFDITATLPPDTTKEQLRMMLQNLLAERFKLQIHRETRELQMYSLVVAKNGPKMKESVETPPPAEGAEAPLPPPVPHGGIKFGPDGLPILPKPSGPLGGVSMMMMNGKVRMIGAKQSMEQLVQQFTGQLNRAVIDATGLTAKYDFTLDTHRKERVDRRPHSPGPPPLLPRPKRSPLCSPRCSRSSDSSWNRRRVLSRQSSSITSRRLPSRTSESPVAPPRGEQFVAVGREIHH